MKYVIAVIQPHKLSLVQEALREREIYLMTVSEVLGCGRQQGHARVYRGKKEAGNLLRKIKLEIGVNDEFVEPCIEAISQAAYSEQIGAGKIFVLDLEDCYRIRTKERGNEAIG